MIKPRRRSSVLSRKRELFNKAIVFIIRRKYEADPRVGRNPSTTTEKPATWNND
jgi:hypothetical protein